MKHALAGPTEEERLAKLAGVTLGEDEALLATGDIHGAVYWKGVAVVIVGVLLLPTFAMSLGLFLMFVGVIMLVFAQMTRIYLLIAATNKRMILRSGYFYADMIEIRYPQMESLEVGATPLGQIFGYGNVIVTGTGQRRIIVPFIANAVEFRQRVNDALIASA